jgi:hypothetical protein
MEKLGKIGCKIGFTVHKDRLTFKVGIGVFRNLCRKTLYSLLEIEEGS